MVLKKHDALLAMLFWSSPGEGGLNAERRIHKLFDTNYLEKHGFLWL
jgi:hypothetical protein